LNTDPRKDGGGLRECRACKRIKKSNTKTQNEDGQNPISRKKVGGVAHSLKKSRKKQHKRREKKRNLINQHQKIAKGENGGEVLHWLKTG